MKFTATFEMTAEEHIRAAAHHLRCAQDRLLIAKRVQDAKQPMTLKRIMGVLVECVTLIQILKEKLS